MTNDFERGFEILDCDLALVVRLEHVETSSYFVVVFLELLVDLGEESLQPLRQRVRFPALHNESISVRAVGGRGGG